MDELICSEFKLGRRLLGRLPYGKDIITSIEDFCMTSDIQTATFSVMGAVSSATIGVYDQKQHVYVTFAENAAMEIVNCIGNVSLKNKTPVIQSHIVLADENGKIIGGRLFSETILFAGEIDLQEMTGKPLERVYDDKTGLMLWNLESLGGE
jgi:predicted DNA-binding protein with PD1-like motif